jgi:hypothetical protein
VVAPACSLVFTEVPLVLKQREFCSLHITKDSYFSRVLLSRLLSRLVHRRIW